MSLLETIFDIKSLDLYTAEELMKELEDYITEDDVQDVMKEFYSDSKDNLDIVFLVYTAALRIAFDLTAELHRSIDDIEVYANYLDTRLDNSSEFRDNLDKLHKLFQILR